MPQGADKTGCNSALNNKITSYVRSLPLFLDLDGKHNEVKKRCQVFIRILKRGICLHLHQAM